IIIILFVNVLRKDGMILAGVKGLLFGWIFCVALMYWVGISSQTWISVPLLGLVEGFFYAIVAVIIHQVYRSPFFEEHFLWRITAASVVWVGGEIVRSTVPLGGLSWGIIAFSQNSSPLIRLAPWGSTWLVAFFTIYVALLVEYACSRGTHYYLSSRFFSLFLASLLTLIISFLPMYRHSEGSIRAAFIQGSIAHDEESNDWTYRSLDVTTNIEHVALSLQDTDVDIVVLPESTSDIDIRTNDEARKHIENIYNHFHAPILLGTQSFSKEHRTNDYLVWNNGVISDVYSKKHPVPFGEYVPYEEKLTSWFPVLKNVGINMVSGNKDAYVDIRLHERNLRVATPICFEVGYGDIVADAVTKNADLIIVPTNNASFGYSFESEQQFDMSHFRAIEHGKTTLQISTVGVSGVIAAGGQVMEKTKLWEPDARIVELPLHTYTTFATTHYSYVTIFFLVCTGGVILVLLTEKFVRAMRRWRKKK
ncbi:MAG: apolipoprotein N-acyltransferase, partial [Actinomycetaceae bacterium]|nr:apolipoprotein N-acyltransferase [Actinomycetaceae bacterium]